MKIYRLSYPNSSVSIAGTIVEFKNGEAEVEDAIGNILLGLKGYSAEKNQTGNQGNQKSPEPEKTENSLEDGKENSEENDEEKSEDNFSEMSVDQLKKLAKSGGVYKSGMTKQEIIEALSK
jgi:hypothetical protein